MEAMTLPMVDWSYDARLRVLIIRSQAARTYHLFEALLEFTIAFSEFVFWGCSDRLTCGRVLRPCDGATGNRTYGIQSF